jgi:hypothetical protein
MTKKYLVINFRSISNLILGLNVISDAQKTSLNIKYLFNLFDINN